jgi:hypothetical protein
MLGSAGEETVDGLDVAGVVFGQKLDDNGRGYRGMFVCEEG